jgi:predicted RNase H-like HicB family nuclease
MKTTAPRYLVKIWFSDEDGCYLAEVPALRGCTTHGRTYAQAAAHAEEAMQVWLSSAQRHGDPIPEPDYAAEEITRLHPILSVAKLARRAGVNQHTLASKLRRGTRFSREEATAVRRALEVA